VVGRKNHHPPVKPMRNKISKALEARKTKDREEGGVKPPFPGKQISESILSLEKILPLKRL
jgi:hypothetical protein